jgi:hypothetical protein
MRFIHPLTALAFDVTSLPNDFSLEAADLLSTFEALKSLPEVSAHVDREKLDPTTFFSSSELLAQKDVLGYEAAIKDTLQCLLTNSNVQSASSLLRQVVDRLSDSAISKAKNSILNIHPDKDTMLPSLINLLADLRINGHLVK